MSPHVPQVRRLDPETGDPDEIRMVLGWDDRRRDRAPQGAEVTGRLAGHGIRVPTATACRFLHALAELHRSGTATFRTITVLTRAGRVRSSRRSAANGSTAPRGRQPLSDFGFSAIDGLRVSVVDDGDGTEIAGYLSSYRGPCTTEVPARITRGPGGWVVDGVPRQASCSSTARVAAFAALHP